MVGAMKDADHQVEDEMTLGERIFDHNALHMSDLTFRRVVNLSRPTYKRKDTGEEFTCYETALIARAVSEDGTAMEMPITRQMFVELCEGVMYGACLDA